MTKMLSLLLLFFLVGCSAHDIKQSAQGIKQEVDAVLHPAPPPKWALVLTAICKTKGLDWEVYDYPEDAVTHNWTADAYPKEHSDRYWACKEDGGVDYWFTYNASSPQEAAENLTEMLKGPPNMKTYYCDKDREEDERGQAAINKFRDKREWRGN